MTGNLYDLLAATARRQPDQPALLGPAASACVTYCQLHQAICDVDLARLGIRPGACVGLHVPSGKDYIVLAYAIWRAGGCVVPISMELTVPEKEEIGRRIGMTWIITETASRASLASLLHDEATPVTSSTQLVPLRAPRPHPAEFERIHAAFIRFTSGTTGAAKGVVLSHETIRERMLAANEALHIGPEDRVVWLLSMSYHFAVTIVAYLSFGASIVLPANNLAQSVLGAVHDHKATLLYASPLHYAWLASAPSSAAPPASLRLALSTTSALEAATADAFQRRFGLPVTQALGIIEVGLPCINLEWARERPEAVGRVLPAYRLRLEDVGLGGNVGAIHLAGPGLLDAYYDPWQPRATLAPQGWFATGDVGALDSDGCLWLRGRVNDVINVMGLKFFPQEVESVLEAHPAVAAACVLRQPDARLGESPVARVVVKPGMHTTTLTTDLLAHCKDRLAEWKIPQRIEWAAALPRTASGKLLRRVTD